MADAVQLPKTGMIKQTDLSQVDTLADSNLHSISRRKASAMNTAICKMCDD